MKDSLGSQLDVIDKNLIEEQARCTVEEITRLRDRSSCLRDCRRTTRQILYSRSIDGGDEDTARSEYPQMLRDDRIRLFDPSQTRGDDVNEGRVTEESTMAITRILYARVADFRDLLIGKLNSWFKQALVFPPTRVASITQMHVCVGDTTEASMNLTAMSNLQVLNDWLGKLADNIMKNIVHHIINGDGFSVVSHHY
ncbi:hypothetical protein PENTCL1PPCAC_26723 [Pristionchus entomophagus]|uniref:Uncharacterized protein n=1 Tax=Pristionchus entomophagus TaxID=358040 RepID=A0AAV5UC83_9BILA|nr:hypothetical protein PENTCL1PPCAC_26723 [Pristionchus entomophagus]